MGPNPYMQSVIVGLLLGDAWLEKSNVNARFRFEQSHIRTEFFFEVYKFFLFYCRKEPGNDLIKEQVKHIKHDIFLAFYLLSIIFECIQIRKKSYQKILKIIWML